MSSHELRDLLDQVADTREIVLRRPATWARRTTRGATRATRRGRVPALGRAAGPYAVYLAAQDREDAAQDSLAQTQMSRTNVS